MLSVQEYANINRQTWSGHNHTEFCSHGSGEDVEDYIKAAIKAGYKTYSITEHFPMPPEFFQAVSGSKHAIYTAAMHYNDLPDYMAKMKQLKAKYADQIRILIGFEFDFIEQFADWTKRQLDLFAPQIDDAILSVHFLPTASGLRAVDDSMLDFNDGVLSEYNTPLHVAKSYLQTVKNAVLWDFPNKPHRYGHIMLYRKWRNLFNSQTMWENNETKQLLTEIFELLKMKQAQLDCNMAGLFTPTQTESCPNDEWLQEALHYHIPLVYGSDAHSVDAITQGYNTYLEKHYYQ